MTISHWQRSHTFTVPDIQTDILIVGAGYVGLSTAWWITEMSPGIKVTVIERSRPGAGASGRNAGFLTKGSAFFYQHLTQKWGKEKALEIFRYAETSLDLLNQNILKGSPELKAEKTSSLTLTRKKSELENLSADFRFEWTNTLPLKLAETYEGAFTSAPEYKINPMELIHTLRKNLEARKVQIIESSGAFELFPEGARTVMNTIKCKKVILALNGYAPEFHQAFSYFITPNRAQMVAIETEEDLEIPSLYYDPAERVYWRKAGDKSILLGGKRLLDEKNEAGDFEKVSPLIQEGLEKYVRDVLKLNYKVIHRWSGIMGFTEHELPLMTKVEASLPVWFVGGFSGHGMGMGFHAGKEISEMVCGEKDEAFFQKFFSPKISL
jgi:glycine/D-amino acid oxidase-like deaminating enzyme